MHFLGLHHILAKDNLNDSKSIDIKSQAVFKHTETEKYARSHISSIDMLIYEINVKQCRINLYKICRLHEQYRMYDHVIYHLRKCVKLSLEKDYAIKLKLSYNNRNVITVYENTYGHSMNLSLRSNKGCMFMSCNGSQSDEKINLEKHWSQYFDQSKKCAFVFGLGDQTYMDNMDSKRKIFMRYIHSFYGDHSFNKQLNRSVCQFLWDDHEYNNDWTYDDFQIEPNTKQISVPPKFVHCHFYYHLFQKFYIQNENKQYELNPFGRLGDHRYFILEDTLFVHLDTRSEKTKSYMLRKSTYDSFFILIQKHVHQFKNICIMMASPITLPEMGKQMRIVKGVDDWMKRVFGQTNYSLPFCKNIKDMWLNKKYKKELHSFMNRLSKILKNKKINVISGDVHCSIDCIQKINGNFIRHLTTSSASNKPISSLHAMYLNSIMSKQNSNSKSDIMYKRFKSNSKFICTKNNILCWDKNSNIFKFIFCK